MNAKCPHCESIITSLRLSGVNGAAPNSVTYKCVVLACPSCNAALSAQIDPLAIKTDTINALRHRH